MVSRRSWYRAWKVRAKARSGASQFSISFCGRQTRADSDEWRCSPLMHKYNTSHLAHLNPNMSTITRPYWSTLTADVSWYSSPWLWAQSWATEAWTSLLADRSDLLPTRTPETDNNKCAKAENIIPVLLTDCLYKVKGKTFLWWKCLNDGN